MSQETPEEKQQCSLCEGHGYWICCGHRMECEKCEGSGVKDAAAKAMTNDEINRKISEARNEWSPYWDRVSDARILRPKDWTGSEDASAVLFDELRDSGSDEFKKLLRYLSQTGSTFDRKIAVALAWLKWKGL